MTNMTSRELVIKTLEFACPARIPRQLWTLPWAENHYPEQLKKIQNEFPDDIVNAPVVYRQKPHTVGQRFEIGTYIDEWGCAFESKERGILGEVKMPFVQEWSDIDKVRVPSEMLSIDVEQVNTYCRHTDKFVIAADKTRPFERVQWLRGTENVYMDIAVQSQEFMRMLAIVHQFYLKELAVWAKTDVDALYISDDWGSQNSMLISPQIWRRDFKPLYKEYADIAHGHGKYLFMHSDGYILEIIPDLIELGVDAINCELFLIGVEELGRCFRGQITFWGGIDSQHLLCEGNANDVNEAVILSKEALYENGGVIAQCEFGPGAKPDNVCAVFGTWDTF
jgi:uroporphyrinogen decarboxylase